MEIPHNCEVVEECILCDSSNIVSFDKSVLMYTCNDCGLIFDNPRPTQEAIWDHYSQQGKYDHWIESDKNFQLYWRAFLKQLLVFKQGGNLLDVGAGIGMFLSRAKNHFDVTGTEVSSEAIQVAKERYGLDFFKGELEGIDFQNKKFDVITMCQILEHFPYPGKTLDYIKTLLNPEGLIYIVVPNEAQFSFRMILAGLFSRLGLQRFKDFTSQGYRKLEIDVLDEIHLSHFSDKSVCKVLESKGFEILKTTIEFHDPYMQKGGAVQIVRHGVRLFSQIVKSIYNLFA